MNYCIPPLTRTTPERSTELTSSGSSSASFAASGTSLQSSIVIGCNLYFGRSPTLIMQLATFQVALHTTPIPNENPRTISNVTRTEELDSPGARGSSDEVFLPGRCSAGRWMDGVGRDGHDGGPCDDKLFGPHGSLHAAIGHRQAISPVEGSRGRDALVPVWQHSSLAPSPQGPSPAPPPPWHTP